MLEHGGRLKEAAKRYKIPLADWLDLSTGINPNGWPVPPIPASCWARLPEEQDGLIEAASHYYGTDQLLAVAGSQAAIQTLPTLFTRSRVGIIDPGYGEHHHAWQQAGHKVLALSPDQISQQIGALYVLVLIHPNNPTGERFSTDQLRNWQEQLAMRGGTLIIDEAFMDTTPEHSLVSDCGQKGLIILKSMGKFFGLAGARVGFVAANHLLLDQLRERLGPWALNGPARYVATKALQDSNWQNKTRQLLQADGKRLAALLASNGLPQSTGCALFQWGKTEKSAEIHEALARSGIFTRLFKKPPSLRFGLPGNEAEWQRLEAALLETT